MKGITLIPHKKITDQLLSEIIRIKSIAWPYPFERQLEWIRLNINDNDIHALLSDSECYVSYLNLIEIELLIDGELKGGYGIGNVCSLERGRGWGGELITETNSFLMRSNRTGLLFCKSILVDFYGKYSWILAERGKLILPFNNEKIETMTFNIKPGYNSLQYSGREF